MKQTDEINIVCADYWKECIKHEFELLRESIQSKMNTCKRVSEKAGTNGDEKDSIILHNKSIFYENMLKEIDKYVEWLADDEMEKQFKI